MMRRVGILGGMFDPIHRGHIDLARAAESALELARVFLVPASVPPHRPQPMASSFHRFAMTALSVGRHPKWLASDLELLSEGPSYTSATLRTLLRLGYARSELFFLIGADAFLEIASWKDYPQLLDLAHFAVVSRPGFPVSDLAARLPQLASRMVAPVRTVSPADPLIILIDAQTADVSSTAIRRRAAAGESIAGMVDPAVQQHIEQHELYRDAAPIPAGDDQPLERAAGRLHAETRHDER